MIGKDFKAALTRAGTAYRELTRLRNEDFRETLVFKNIDLSDAVFEAQIRHLPDSGGEPLATITMGAPVYALGDTTVAMSLDRIGDNLGGLPAAPETGQNAVFYWDARMTWNGFTKTFVGGPFTVVPGSTRA